MTTNPTILLVDDDSVFRRTVSRALERRGYRVISASSGEEALELDTLLESESAIVDLNMAGMDGLELLKRLRETCDEIPVIVLTGYGSIETAIEAIQLGAFHYMTKPCEIAELDIYLKKAIEQQRIRQENEKLRNAIQRSEATHGIVGESKAIHNILSLIDRFKDSESSALISGESGTGKELVARALHYEGTRKEHPFVAINCATLKPELLENELFGHVAGAFTGATQQKAGLFSVADQGTLFIDEIADMNPNLQASLLRVIETGEFRALGSTKLQKTQTRIIAAVNRDLKEQVAAGNFREDFYYRLNVLVLHIPPLRERREDIPLLVEVYLSRSAQGSKGKRFSQEALDIMRRYDWPGNVRELFNICERAILLSNEDEIQADTVANLLNMPSSYFPSTQKEEEGGFRPRSLEEFEKEAIQQTLEYTQNNVSRAAELLEIDRRTLQRKMARHGLRESV